jgi:hypothetical protein
MSTVSSMRGFACGAGDAVRVRARQFVLALAFGSAALMVAPEVSRADSGNEWLRETFARSSVQRFDSERYYRKPSRKFAKPSKLGAYLPEKERPRRKKSNHVRTASLGPTPIPSAPSEPVTGGGKVRWVANANCLTPSLRSVINHIAANYGSVRVNSTCRSRAHNRRVGGAPRSYHLTGNAADIRVFGNVRAVYAYLKTAVGGLKHYGGGLFHIDTGPRRRW